MSKTAREANEERANRMAPVVAEYANLHSGGEEEAITDILTDLRHLCDELGVNLYAADRMAYQHYLCEKADARQKPKQQDPAA